MSTAIADDDNPTPETLLTAIIEHIRASTQRGRPPLDTVELALILLERFPGIDDRRLSAACRRGYDIVQAEMVEEAKRASIGKRTRAAD